VNHDLEDEMCPNCVTPWKCNGPHILEGDNEMNEHVSQWRGLDEEQKASIAVELLTGLLKEIEDHLKVVSEYPDFSNRKDHKAMKRTRKTLIYNYNLPNPLKYEGEV